MSTTDTQQTPEQTLQRLQAAIRSAFEYASKDPNAGMRPRSFVACLAGEIDSVLGRDEGHRLMTLLKARQA
ncbi:MAG TPA: hypothetical protein VIM12_05750 [Noviherbaspirillum sp.]|uniref:hypothetical protein n=1 Tax=Noviherbaspirillum sp. TaxID=1926288 RepID=UPI002F934C35